MLCANAALSTQCQQLPAQLPDLPVKCSLCVYTFLYIYIPLPRGKIRCTMPT